MDKPHQFGSLTTELQATQRPKIGIVTVTYNSREVLDGFMTSIRKQTYNNFCLYIVDNLSTDGTPDYFASLREEKIVFIVNQQNVGVAAGNNQGIQAALKSNCDLVLLINNDTEFDADLLSKLVAALERHEADMITPKIMYYKAPGRLWYAGGRFSARRGYSGVHEGMNEVDRGQFDRPRQVEYSPTCCLLIRAEVFHKIGIMDESYFIYWDDTDFCFRAKTRGIRLFFSPDVRVFHKVSSLTGGPKSASSIFFGTRNHVYFLLKNFPAPQSIFFLAAYQCLFLCRFLVRAYTRKSIRLAEDAFAAGVRMFVLCRRGGEPGACALNLEAHSNSNSFNLPQR